MEHSYIQNDLELKSLLLYILARAEGPVDLPTLTDVALCDGGFTYFDLTTALSDLVNSEHVTQQEQKYRITVKGLKNGSVTEDDLPYTVRMLCDRQLSAINERFRMEKRVHTQITRQAVGWQAELVLDGERSNLLTMTVTVPLQEDAQALEERFRRDPMGFYQLLTRSEGSL